MNATLAEQQRVLMLAIAQQRQADALELAASVVAATHTGSTQPWQRGLLAYRANAHELAQRSLAATYPVVAELLGEENCAPLARQFWLQHPPRRGDLAQWGESFAAWLARVPTLADDEPYLPDVARVEWAAHLAALAADACPDAASLGLLAEHDPAHVSLVLGPGAWVIASSYPVVSIVQAHLAGDPPLQEAGQRLRAGHAEAAVVWRDGQRPRLREALTGEARFVQALQENASLLDSLAAAPDFDFSSWLAPAFQGGLLAGVRRI